MIRLAEEKDFLQLAHMRWEHKKEDDATYGEDNITGIDGYEFIEEYVNFLKTESVYKIFIMEKNEQIIAAMFVTMIRKVPKPNKKIIYSIFDKCIHFKRVQKSGNRNRHIILHKKLPETKQM